MNLIDKSAVRRSFNLASSHYDANAHLQYAIANRLIAYAKHSPSRAIQILDAGAGSGISTEILSRAFPNNHIVGLDFAQEMLKIAHQKLQQLDFICGDIEILPFATSTFDLVYSSSTLQWSGDLKTALNEFGRVMKKGSELLISTYTDGTLHELQDSWSRVDNEQHTLEFSTSRELCSLLKSAGMVIKSCQTQAEVVLYSNVNALLNHLKHTGVRNLRQDRCANLTPPSKLENMKKQYKTHHTVLGQISASYMVTFIQASKPQTVNKKAIVG